MFHRSDSCTSEHKNACIVLFLLVASLFLSGFGGFAAAPTANDDYVQVDEDSYIVIAVLDNDENVATDPENRKIKIVDEPDEGAVSISNETTIKYEPTNNFYGTDSFVYEITNIGEGSSQARVTIEVNQVNDPPIPEKELLTTREETPVRVKLSATDKDIDPMKPYLHPVEFEILSGPSNGKLIGDVHLVQFYKSPHEVFVEVQYIPDPGFKGMDSITYSVKDKEGGFNISSIRIDVIPETAPPVSFSGYLGTSATFEENSENPFSGFRTSLLGIYRYNLLELRANAGWSMDEMSSLKLQAEIPLTGLGLDMTLDFDPNQKDQFNYWKTEADFYYGEIDYNYTFNLDQDSEDIYHELQAKWNWENMSFTGRALFSGPEPKFDETTFLSRYSWVDCGLSVYTDLSFDNKGFDEFVVDVGEVPLFYGIYLEVETTLTPETKTVKPSLFYRSELFDCLRLRGALVSNDRSDVIEGWSLTGISLRNTFPNEIQVHIKTNLKHTNHSLNEVSLSGPFYAGYQAPGRWRISTDFGSNEGDQLFGWEKLKLKAIAPVAEDLDIETILTFQPETPSWKFQFAGEIFW